MSAKIKGINAPPEWTFWTIEMAQPVIFAWTEPINKAIIYDGDIRGGGIPPGGDTIREIRAFIDINALPVATYTPVGIVEDGKSYLFDFQTSILREGKIKSAFFPLILIGSAIGAVVLITKKRRK